MGVISRSTEFEGAGLSVIPGRGRSAASLDVAQALFKNQRQRYGRVKSALRDTRAGN